LGQKAAADAYNKQQQAAAAAAAAAAAKTVTAHLAPVANSGGGSSQVDQGASAGAPSGSAVDTAVAAAERWVGTIYAWGGGSLTGPSAGIVIDAGVVCFDCSGLTRYAYAQAGIIIPRNSSAQYEALPKVSSSNLQRGCLVFYANDPSGPSTIHHVAMYLGNNQIIEAPESGETIHITSMRW